MAERYFDQDQISEKDFSFDSFSGLRNNVGSQTFDLTDLDAALNLDIDDRGQARRRGGFSSYITATEPHSIWSPISQWICLFVVGSSLKRIMEDGSAVTLATVTSGQPMSFMDIGARVYWSNGIESGCIDNGANRSWGLVEPGAPSVAAAGGTLRGGIYQACLTYLRNDGQESGASDIVAATVGNPGGLSFTNIPVSTDPTVTRKVIYVSDWNGDQVYRALVMANSVTSIAYTDRGPCLLPLNTSFLQGPPPGQIVSQFRGHSLVALDSVLYRSLPYAPELFDLRVGTPFPKRVTLIAPVDGGIFLGTETEVWWLTGKSPTEFEAVLRAAYGAIPGTLTYADSALFGEQKTMNPTAVFATTEGIVAGSPDGGLSNLTRERFMYPVQPQGAGVVRQSRGTWQYVVNMRGAETAVKTYQ